MLKKNNLFITGICEGETDEKIKMQKNVFIFRKRQQGLD